MEVINKTLLVIDNVHNIGAMSPTRMVVSNVNITKDFLATNKYGKFLPLC
jgi:hypothetical protein